MLRKPSDQQLENEFGSKRDTDVVQQILEKGALQSADAPRSSFGTTNFAKGSGSIDVRGKSYTTGI